MESRETGVSEGSEFTDFLAGGGDPREQAGNPAAPLGARQGAAQAAAGADNKFTAFLAGTANVGTGMQGYAGAAQQWMTGANQEGTNNGWENEFVDDFYDNFQASVEAGEGKNYFDSPGVTGVVTWDHTSERSGADRTFGDVYDHGTFKGNLYDQYDRYTADLMMSQWVLDAKTQAEAYGDSDREVRLRREIEDARDDRNDNFEDSLSSMKFQGDVKDRAEDFGEGTSALGVIGASTASGAALGAGLATVAGPVGTLAGGLIGGGAGFLGGLLNQDALNEQAARGYEITRMSFDENGWGAGSSTLLSQTAQFGSKTMMPTTNILQGSYDLFSDGGIGDNEVAFYATDDEGKRKAPMVMRGLDVGATVVDSLIQFASPIGLLMYSAQMGGTIVGEVGELSLSGGKTFDFRSGSYDNIFTDDEGNTDWMSAAAGIGKIGIDAVQLGMARGLAGRANALRSQVGLDDAAYLTATSTGVGSKLPLWAGGARNIEADAAARLIATRNMASDDAVAAAAGATRVRAGGYSFTKLKDGTVVDGTRRATLGLLAPSEQLSSLSNRVQALRTAQARGGALTADDFYRAASTMRDNKVGNALVNGLGEGYEEAVQAVLEPLSHHGRLDGGEIMQAAIYGAAAGVGMGFGMSARQPSESDRMLALTQAAEFLRYGASTMTQQEWDKLTPEQQSQMAVMSQMEGETTKAAHQSLSQALRQERAGGVAALEKLEDAVRSSEATALARMTDTTDAPFVISQLEEAPLLDPLGNITKGVPNNSVAASALQTANNLINHARGMVIALRSAEKKLTDAHAKLKADPANTDLLEDVARRKGQVLIIQKTLEIEKIFSKDLEIHLVKIQAILDTTPNFAEAVPLLEAEVAVANKLLRDAFDMKVDKLGGEKLSESDKLALARAVTLTYVRDPQDQSGSFQVLVPQISARLTAANAANVLEISHAILPAIRGDYDGDKIRSQAQLIFDDTQWESARAGTHFVGAGASVNMPAPSYEAVHVEHLAEALSGKFGTTAAAVAQQTRNFIGSAIRNRYQGRVSTEVLDQVLEEYFLQLEAGNKEARTTLIDGLARYAPRGLTSYARDNKSNEWLWLDQLVTSSLQQFNSSYVRHRPEIGKPGTRSAKGVHRMEPDVKERASLRRATQGQTLAARGEGDSLFRKFQKLHYSVGNAPVLSAKDADTMSLSEQSEFYRELGQLINASAIEKLNSKDEITNTVMQQLQLLADDFQKLHPDIDSATSMMIVANLQVENFTIDSKGEISSQDGALSLTQMLLRQALMAHKRKNIRSFDSNPDMQAQHANLERLTRPSSSTYATGAAEAFVEVFGAQQFYTLLGEEAATFGAHLTVEQYIRQYMAMSPDERTVASQSLRLDNPSYTGRVDKEKALPYQLDEVKNGEITGYRAVVDAILAVANGRVAIDADTGVLSGSLPRQSQGVTDKFVGVHARVREAFTKFLDASPRRAGETDAAVLERMFNANPQFARSLMDLIPDASANIAFQAREDGVYVPNWLYDMFTMQTAKEAEMHYWRMLLLTQWHSKLDQSSTDGIEFHKLDRRMERLMFRLASMPDGQLVYQQFINKLEEATDLEAFLKWVNTEPGILGQQAPIVAWVDDISDFDPDRAKGGWTTAMQGAELRTSIATLRQQADRLVSDVKSLKATLEIDATTHAAIRRALRYRETGLAADFDEGDMNLLKAFEGAIELAGSWNISVGTQIMVQETVGAVVALQAQSHNKGNNPDNVAPIGAVDAVRDAFGHELNYERVLGDMTSINLAAINNNLPQTMKDGGRSMDDDGVQVEWGKPSASEMLDLLENPETAALAREQLFPQVLERSENGAVRSQMLVNNSLGELLSQVSHRKLFNDQGSMTLDQAFRYLSMIDGFARSAGGHFSVIRAANELALLRTSAATNPMSLDSDPQSAYNITLEAYLDLARHLQMVGHLEVLPHTAGTESRLDKMRRSIKRGARAARVGRMLGLDPEWNEEKQRREINLLVLQKEKEADDLAQLAAEKDATPEQIAAASEAQEEYARFEKHIEILLTDDVASAVAEKFSMDAQVLVAPPAMASNIEDLEARADTAGEIVLFHGGLAPDATIGDIDLDRSGTQQNKRGKTYGGFYLTDNSPRSREWSLDYARNRNGILHGFRINKTARVLELTENIDRLSKEQRDDYAQTYDLIKGVDMLGRVQYVLLNKAVVREVEVDNLTELEAKQQGTALLPRSANDLAERRARVLEYAENNLTIIEQAGASHMTVMALTNQLMTPSQKNNPKLSDEQWVELSNAVIGIYLDDVVGGGNTGMSVSPWPTGDRTSDQKYYDASGSYILDDTMDSSKPLAKAARIVALAAGRDNMPPLSSTDFVKSVFSSVLNLDKIGEVTSDVRIATIEANQRMDSAAAEAAISMAGDSPKRLAALMAATRRTYLKPDDSMLSRTTLAYGDLNGHAFADLEIEHGFNGPQSTVVKRPLIQMQGRFAKSVMLKYTAVDGTVQSIDITNEAGLPWYGDDSVRDSGYQEINLGSLRTAIEKTVRSYGLTPDTATIEVEFFHPDMQPETPPPVDGKHGANWYNNVYFEGTSFELAGADRHDSLMATLWFSFGSLSPEAQAAALDASKLGIAALQVIDRIPAADVEALEAGSLQDLGKVIRAKVQRILQTDLGNGALSGEFYNAVTKDMMLRHWVKGFNEAGEPQLWSAEMVMAFQLANPGEDLPLAEASLWMPTSDVLRSMMGEIGGKGVRFDPLKQLSYDPSTIPNYRGPTAAMVKRFNKGLSSGSVGIADTKLRHRSGLSQHQVRTMLSDKQKSAHDQKVVWETAERKKIWDARQDFERSDTRFKPVEQMQRVMQEAGKALKAEDLRVVWRSMGLPIGPRDPKIIETSEIALRNFVPTYEADGYRNAFTYEHGGKAREAIGFMTQVSLTDPPSNTAYHVAPGDLVLVRVDSFEGDTDAAAQVIRTLTDKGAIIILGGTDGATEMRVAIQGMLEGSVGYESVVGSQHIYQRMEHGPRFQNIRSRESDLMETHGIKATNRVAVFSTIGLKMEENAAYADFNNPRLSAIAEVVNMVPTSALADFNLPSEGMGAASKTRALVDMLVNLDNNSGRNQLVQQAVDGLKGKQRSEEMAKFLADWRKLIDRISATDGGPLPKAGDEFGIGDIIPLIDSQNRVMLYRHGYKGLSGDEVTARADIERRDTGEPMGIAVYQGEREPAATANTGNVVEFRTRKGFGLEVELNIPLQVYGDKKQLEWNGMKYVLIPRPDSVKLPRHGFFRNRAIDILSDLKSLLGKEATESMVINHRNAFAFFGIDFLPDVTEHFFPGEGGVLERQQEAYERLLEIQRHAEKLPIGTVNELISSQHIAETVMSAMPESLRQQINSKALFDLTQSQVSTQITRGIILYLLAPGARVEDVLRSGGLNDEQAKADDQSRVMPRLFTQIFDRAKMDSPLRLEINQRLNDQIYDPDGNGSYRLHPDFTFEVRGENGEKNMIGRLSLPEAHSAGDNPVRNGQSFNEYGKSAVSAHTAAILYGATGAEIAASGSLKKAQQFADRATQGTYQQDELDGSFWKSLNGVSKKSAPKYWNMPTPAEAHWINTARGLMVQFRQALVKDKDHGWSTTQRTKYDLAAIRIVEALGLTAAQAPMVDMWVRQLHGRPFGRDEQNEDLGRVTGADALKATEDILWNVRNGFFPVAGGEVPLMHLHDVQTIFRASQASGKGWAPKENVNEPGRVSGWTAWVEVALGSGLDTDNSFDPLYLRATDGLMHTYQNATGKLANLPVSRNTLMNHKLMDPDLNKQAVSIMKEANLIAGAAPTLDTVHSTLETLITGERVTSRKSFFTSGHAAPASVVAQRRAARRAWRLKNNTPIPADQSMANFRENGGRFIDEGTETAAALRMLIQLRLGMALINPALYVSMGPEQWYRGTIDTLGSLVTLQGTAGVVAKGQSKMSARLQESGVGPLLRSMGLVTTFNETEIISFETLYDTMGRRNDFRGMMYHAMKFDTPKRPGQGGFESAFEWFGSLGTRMQDPTYGMRAPTMARRYVESAIETIMFNPGKYNISIPVLVAQLAQDPMWLQKTHPEIHRYASNRVSNVRSMKTTVLSHTMNGVINPLSHSSKLGRQYTGQLLLNLPLFFRNYAANVATNLLGMNGFDQAIAMMAEGRKKGPWSLGGRFQSFLAGEKYDEKKHGYLDMSSIIESADLTSAFIKGGVTHYGLFALGMWAGSLGLGGEDDEMRKRRLMAENQGLGNLYDPRRIENDFRNADAFYLDALPAGLGNLFGEVDEETGRNMVELHWIAKQFISPIMGIEKFFQTGDFRQVTWGFMEAVGAFPLVNSMLWDDAVNTVELLQQNAQEAAADGTAAGQVESAGFLTRAVQTYESMLFESSFINQIYTGTDRYDRNPYVLPLRDSDGDIQRDMQNQARQQNLALQTFIDPETGKARRGYESRSEGDAALHALTENRATLAFVSSLFTGGINDSDYWRYNMPIKTRVIEKDPINLEEAKAYLRGAAAWEARNQPNLTIDEILPQVRNELYQNKEGKFYEDHEVREIARAILQGQGTLQMSLVDDVGDEVFTDEGAAAVMRGLWKGTMELGGPDTEGLFITVPQREKIQAQFTKELTQDGIERGLNKTQAISRMKRIMYGPPGGDGLFNILWSPEETLSYSKNSTYAQLNTTYVMGPDGKPWATGFQRSKLMNALGLAPFQKSIPDEHGGTRKDARGNTVNLVNGSNTGLRSLEPMDSSRNIPTDKEMNDSLIEAIKEAGKQDYEPFQKNYGDGEGSGFKGYGYRSYGGGSSGGGGGAYFTKMYSLPSNISPYGNSLPAINTSNPIVRRTYVRRERVWSERGRLKQWQ